MFFVTIQSQNHILDTGLSCNHLENGEEVFLQVQVQVRLQITEPNRRLKQHTFSFPDIGKMLDLNVQVKVSDSIDKILFQYFLQVCLDFRLEVIQSVNQSSNVSFQRPACSRLFNVSDQLLEWELLDDLTHVDCVVIVD
jgi:hypothetical protein